MALKCYMLDLKDDPELIARYRDWHAPGGPPPSVIASIRQAGIMEMRIFLTGNRLCMIAETTADFDAEARRHSDAGNAEVIEWEARMDAFQQRLPWAKPGEKWVEAEPIFLLSDNV
ncbi:MAG: L-rhamnose mutarotase [Pseudomonadota bacterium]